MNSIKHRTENSPSQIHSQYMFTVHRFTKHWKKRGYLAEAIICPEACEWSIIQKQEFHFIHYKNRPRSLLVMQTHSARRPRWFTSLPTHIIIKHSLSSACYLLISWGFMSDHLKRELSSRIGRVDWTLSSLKILILMEG